MRIYPEFTTAAASFLFCAAHDARKTNRIDDFNAHAVVFDLEDAVPNSQKDAARSRLMEVLERPRSAMQCVRSSGPTADDVAVDLANGLHPNLQCLLLPMVESVRDIEDVDRLLGSLERKSGLMIGSIDLIPMIETARGLLNAAEIAAAKTERVGRLAFGLGDFSIDIGVDLRSEAPFAYARSHLVAVSAAFRFAPPIDGPYIDLGDVKGLHHSCRASRALGMHGRVAVRPDQVATINDAYRRFSDRDVERAKRLISAYEAEEQDRGRGALEFEGEFADYPSYLRALSLVEASRQAATRRGPAG